MFRRVKNWTFCCRKFLNDSDLEDFINLYKGIIRIEGISPVVRNGFTSHYLYYWIKEPKK